MALILSGSSVGILLLSGVLFLVLLALLVVALVLLRSRGSEDPPPRMSPWKAPPPRLPPGRPRPSPRLPPSRSGLSDEDDELVLPPDAVLARAATGRLRTRKFKATMQRAKECVDAQTALIASLRARRDAAYAYEASEEAIHLKAQRAEVLRALEHETALLEERVAHAQAQAELQQVRLEMLKQERLLEAQVQAAIAKLVPHAAPTSLPAAEQAVDEEVQKVAKHFKLLAATVTEAIRFQEEVGKERERVAVSHGQDTAARIVARALDMAGVSAASEAEGGWYRPPEDHHR